MNVLLISLALTAGAADSARLLTMEEALVIADAKNLNLQVARAKLTQAQELTRKVWAAYLPSLSVGGSYTRNSEAAMIAMPTGYVIRDVMQPTSGPFDPTREPGIDNPPGLPTNLIMLPSGVAEVEIQKRDQLGLQVQLNQTLVAPALISAIGSAYTGVKVATLTVENGRRELLFGVAQAYHGTVGAQEALAVFERQRQTAAEHVRDAQVRFDAGTLPKIGLLRAQIDLVRAEADVERTRNFFEGALIVLATLLDEPANFTVAMPKEPPVPGELLSPTEVLPDRPDLGAARASLTLAEQGNATAWWKFAPSVGASAVYRVANVSGFTGNSEAWYVQLGAQWQLYDGGLRESEIRESRAKIVEAKAQLRATENTARQEMKTAALELKTARANSRKAEEQLRLAKENSLLVEASFRAGVSTAVEVADALSAMLGAETSLLGEQLAASLAALKVLKVNGLFMAGAP